MSDTLIPHIIDRAVRVDRFVAPPSEANSNDWWLAATKFAIAIVEENRDLFEELNLLRPNVQTWAREITFSAYSLRELKAYMAMVPQPKEWSKHSDGRPELHATVNGWDLILRRNDLTCNIIETGEYQEVEETEVVTPAEVKKVKRQVPVTVTECPSMLAE